MTPGFPSAATAIRTLCEAVTRETVDGVVLVDPQPLAHVPTLTDPAGVPGGGTVDAEAIVGYLTNDPYRTVTGSEERKALLGDVAAGAGHPLLNTAGPRSKPHSSKPGWPGSSRPRARGLPGCGGQQRREQRARLLHQPHNPLRRHARC